MRFQVSFVRLASSWHHLPSAPPSCSQVAGALSDTAHRPQHTAVLSSTPSAPFCKSLKWVPSDVLDT